MLKGATADAFFGIEGASLATPSFKPPAGPLQRPRTAFAAQQRVPWRPAPLAAPTCHPEGFAAAGDYSGHLNYQKILDSNKPGRVPVDKPKWGQRPLKLENHLRSQRTWQ